MKVNVIRLWLFIGLIQSCMYGLRILCSLIVSLVHGYPIQELGWSSKLQCTPRTIVFVFCIVECWEGFYEYGEAEYDL
jgi:hypothetical protein